MRDTEPMRWTIDHQTCLQGGEGEWWRLRAERAIVTYSSDWEGWRYIRRHETAPNKGNLKIIKNTK